jgi:hypothetical protein
VKFKFWAKVIAGCLALGLLFAMASAADHGNTSGADFDGAHAD